MMRSKRKLHLDTKNDFHFTICLTCSKPLHTYSCTPRWALDNNRENAGTWNSSKHKSQASLLISFATGEIGSNDCVFLTLYCLGTDCFKMCTPGNNQERNALFFFILMHRHRVVSKTRGQVISNLITRLLLHFKHIPAIS